MCIRDSYEPNNVRWEDDFEQANNKGPQPVYTRGERRGNMWRAKFKFKKKNYYLGSFKTQKEAINAIKRKCLEINAVYMDNT